MEIFKDQAAELRRAKAEKYVKENKAKNFEEACKMIKKEEENTSKKHYQSLEEIELRKSFSGRS